MTLNRSLSNFYQAPTSYQALERVVTKTKSAVLQLRLSRGNTWAHGLSGWVVPWREGLGGRASAV